MEPLRALPTRRCCRRTIAADPHSKRSPIVVAVSSHRAERFEEFTDPVDGTRWRIDVAFTDSNWQCLWGNGCQGILDVPAPELAQGCCSEGAHLLGEDEAMLIEGLGLTLDPARFENHAEAAMSGVLRTAPTNLDGGKATRVVNDACIFHNRPGFSGGEEVRCISLLSTRASRPWTGGPRSAGRYRSASMRIRMA